ncbi:ABC transporter permease [Bacillus weihaiensis]|uniref:ABC transporter permease n=1 Tax=Bacillus weihaiensis TaxID=1547283 RepID=UPI002354CFE3|nr:ABC transporter permease [Bacillus weihaiensis]
MKFKDQLQFMFRNMKKNRLRVFMTILATTMACAFLIVLASVGFGIQKSITDEMKSQQMITEVQIHGKEVDGNHEFLTNQNVEELKDTENVTAVVTRNSIDLPVLVSFEDRTADIWPIYITNMEEELKANLSLDEGHVPKNEKEVVVGYHFAKALLTKKEREEFEQNLESSDGTVIEEPQGYQGVLIGKDITIKLVKDVEGKEVEKSYTFTIAGIGKEPARDWVQDQGIFIDDQLRDEMLSFTIDEKNAEKYPYSEVLVYASHLENVEQVSNDLKEKGYMVYSITEELEGVNLFFNIFKAGLIFVGTVAVIIASIGIFNTMTMAVTERTQEIGIMKAIGAQPGVIRRIFLMESAYIGVIGAFIGVVISYGISYAANFAIPIILESASGGDTADVDFVFSYIPLSLVVIAAIISIGVAIISGLRPAMKATNVNVLSALRREL